MVDLVPEVAPRLGIDAGGRLVEQQQRGIGQDAGAEREPLLPAAGKFAGELIGAARADPSRSSAARAASRGSLEAIDARDEFADSREW